MYKPKYLTLRYIMDILIVLNSMTDGYGKTYPFGNKELMEKIKELEKLNLIEYSMMHSRWIKVK